MKDTDTDMTESSRTDDNTQINTIATRRQADTYNLSSNSYEVAYEAPSSLSSGYDLPQATSYQSYAAGAGEYVATSIVGNDRCPDGYTMNNGQCSRSVLRCPPGYSLQGRQCSETVDRLVCPQGFELRDNMCYQIGCIVSQPPAVVIPQPIPQPACPILAPQVVRPPPVSVRYVTFNFCLTPLKQLTDLGEGNFF